MEWIKKNLTIVLGGVVALVLVGGAGFYLYSRMQAASMHDAAITESKQKLETLYNQAPFPSPENTEAASKAQEKLETLLKEVDRFYPISEMSSTNVMSNGEFKLRLIQTIAELQRHAQSANVNLPTNFNFSFTKQYQLMQLASNSPAALNGQVTDVKTICEVLFQAQIPELIMVRRSPVTKDDQEAVSAMPQDYLGNRSLQTNDWSIRYPYEVVFKGLTPELKAVLEGLAHSPRGLVVRTVKVEPFSASATSDDPSQGGVMGETRDFNRALRMRYGLRYSTQQTPTDTTTVTPPKPTVGTILDKQPLKITMMVEAVRPRPPGEAAPAQAAATDQAAADGSATQTADGTDPAAAQTQPEN